MGIDTVTQFAYVIAGTISLVLMGILLGQLSKKNIHWSFVGASAVHTAWLMSIGLSGVLHVSLQYILLLEAAHFCAWVFAISATVSFFCKGALPRNYRVLMLSLCAALISFDIYHVLFSLSWVSIPVLMVVQGILFSVIALVSVEQLYRNVPTVRLIKLFCVSLALLFVYDVYFFSQSLVKPELNVAFFQLRAVLSIVANVFMGVAAIALQNNQDNSARLSLSRPAVFYTASLTLAGSVLSVISLGGYYVGSYDGGWGFVAYVFILAVAFISLVMVFASRNIREHLRVFINKHLFSYKYDYRQEWLKLIDRLSQPVLPGGVHHHALETVATIFKSAGGALWLRRGKMLVPVHQEHLSISIADAIEPEDSPFVQAMEHSSWVFFPSATGADGSLAQNNELLPEWAVGLTEVWLILPLLNESSLIGFMALTRPNVGGALDWEDLDLLKTVGRQVANYLIRQEQVEQLAEARQFEAFNRLSAYVMHDLKNIIAQQALVVKNAEKHKDNPAFIEDAIATIHNSVGRMSHLLRKLQRNEPDGVNVLQLDDVLLESVRRCQKSLPHPSLRSSPLPLKVKGDYESLVMVFVHIIQNAQDATDNSGFIDIAVSTEQNTVEILFEDNGEGMSSEFIRDRLFKPFETTKTGTGMGIGVHQARDYIHVLGGRIAVESTLGEGSSFTVTIPLVGNVSAESDNSELVKV